MKDIRPICLFWVGIAGALVCSVVFTGIGFAKHENAGDFFSQTTLWLLLGIFFFVTVPVFFCMAFVAWRVQRQPTRKLATRCLKAHFAFFFLLACVCLTWFYRILLFGKDDAIVSEFCTLPIGFDALIVCVIILLNLLLRYVRLRRERLPPVVSQSLSDTLQSNA